MMEKYAKDFVCPLLKHNCIGNKCMFWLLDLDNEIEDGCALVRIAREIK